MEAHLENLNLSKRLAILKEKFDVFRDLELWRSEISSGNNSEFDATNFPADFRMLWKITGAGTLGSHPPGFESYHVMHIDAPYKFGDEDGDWYPEYELFGKDEIHIKDVFLIGCDCDCAFYGYNSTQIPYKFVHQDQYYDHDGIISLLESKISELEFFWNFDNVSLGRDEYAINWYKKIAAYGFASAQYLLGLCYKDGKGVAQDYLQAIHWFKLAAAQANRDAQFELGVMYTIADNISCDDAEAFMWFRRAAKQGHLNAIWNLANCYLEGKGVLQDYFQAYVYINILCELSEGRDEGALLDRENYAKNLSDQEIIEANISCQDHGLIILRTVHTSPLNIKIECV
jgi:hypothetical protein